MLRCGNIDSTRLEWLTPLRERPPEMPATRITVHTLSAEAVKSYFAEVRRQRRYEWLRKAKESIVLAWRRAWGTSHES